MMLDNGTQGGIYLDNFDEPDFTEEYLIGPGINANDQKTEYPSSFDMMPVGGYKPLGTGTEVECTATPFGHIVRMSSVSYEDVLKVGIEPRGFPIDAKDKRFFYFSAENAHDGSCNGECEL